MARSANSENIRRDQEGPDYVGAIGLVRGKVRTNEADIQSIAQDNSTLYKRIEKQHGVHRGAAKDFAKIDRMAAEKRTDYLRSLLGLLGAAGYNDFDDLVDRAQKPRGKARDKAAEKGPGASAAKAKAPDAIEEPQTRTNLKSGWIQKPKADIDLTAADLDDDANWEDVREATSEELAAERERIADFDDTDAGPNVHPFPAKQR